ncbi:hypothetical protein RB628_35695, partial [Streptomyces sp. ADMS]|uniref:hypothetical protein n=1 Tax=Streptomyces sp. ADMS TaxID=3071415 RepID=UPI00296E304D
MDGTNALKIYVSALTKDIEAPLVRGVYHLFDLGLRVTNATDPPVIAITRGIQLRLLDLRCLEPTHPRRPEDLNELPRSTELASGHGRK